MISTSCSKHLIFALLVSLIVFPSCKKEISPMYLNSMNEISRVQQQIESVAGSLQIDSLSIRSSEGQSIVSSFYILATDENSTDEFKNTIEYIPSEDLISKKTSKIEKGALHSFTVNLKDLFNYIQVAQDLLPEGFKYNNNVKSIRYSANPFGNKYYFELEVKVPSEEEAETNEYIEWYNVVPYANYQAEAANNIEAAVNGNTIRVYVVQFIVNNNQLEMVKVR